MAEQIFDINGLRSKRNAAINSGEATVEGKMPLTEMFSQAISNVPSSTVNLVEDTMQPFLHPIDTANSLLSLGKGLYQLTTPGEQPDEATAKAVGQYFSNRYGGIENFKRSFASDPMGVLADASIVIGGGAALTGKTASLSGKGAAAAGIVRGASNVAKIADALDPVTAAVRGAEKVVPMTGEAVKSGLGFTTGTGRETIDQAYKAGREGGERQEAFLSNMRGEVPVEDVATEAVDALKQVKTDTSKKFSEDKTALELEKAEVSMDPVVGAMKDLRDSFTFEGASELSKEGQAKLKALEKIVLEWKKSPALHNAKGMDILKRRIDNEYPTGLNAGDAGVVVTRARDAVKKEILNQVPEYAPLMKAYEMAIDLEREMQRALSLGKNSSADTTLRKLQSVMRNNVNANFGSRLNLVKQLENSSDYMLLPKIAGQATNTVTPRGLVPQSMMGGSFIQAAQAFDPTALALAPLTSPRIVGETVQATGAATRNVVDRTQGMRDRMSALADNPIVQAVTNNLDQTALLQAQQRARPIGAVANEAEQDTLNEEQRRLMELARGLR